MVISRCEHDGNHVKPSVPLGCPRIVAEVREAEMVAPPATNGVIKKFCTKLKSAMIINPGGKALLRFMPPMALLLIVGLEENIICPM